MVKLIDHLSVREIKKRLKARNYSVQRFGHVFPDVYNLPDDYPWTFKKNQVLCLKIILARIGPCLVVIFLIQ